MVKLTINVYYLIVKQCLKELISQKRESEPARMGF